MDVDAWLAILKFLGAAIAGTLGAAGVLFDFKSAHGRLNQKGVWVLVGIALAALVGMGSSIIEAQKAKSDSKQQTARAEQLLGEINRAVQPMTKLEAFYWIEISPKDEKTLAYIERIREAADEANSLMKRDRFAFPKNGITPVGVGRDGVLLDGTIDEKISLVAAGRC